MFLQNKDFSVFYIGLILYLTLPYPGTKKIQKGFRKVGRFSVGMYSDAPVRSKILTQVNFRFTFQAGCL